MKRKLLTDVELRAHWSQTRLNTYCVEEGAILTPSARDFIREHNITLCSSPAGGNTGAMTMTPVPTREGKAIYQDAATGLELDHKPEEMTHLRGNLLVPKTHPQIEFRGRLDSLMANIMQTQQVALQNGDEGIAQDLDEILSYARSMLAAEVKDKTLTDLQLLGMDSHTLRYTSHHIKEVFGIPHPVPHYTMGPVVTSLNYLRTQVRETELCAARAFTEKGVQRRKDIIEGLNRMSSCVYIILCRKLSGHYKGGR